MNVLIVDDDINTIRYIQAQTRWETIGITNVYEALDINQAKELLNAYKIEILLCDIEMPSGSGMELIQWVKKTGYQSMNIFITCHDEFMLAQQAISLGAFSYMLKPVAIEELENTISQAIIKFKENTILQQLSKLKPRNHGYDSATADYPWQLILTSSPQQLKNYDSINIFSAVNIFFEKEQEHLRDEPYKIKELLEGILEPLTTDYALPVLLFENRTYLMIIVPFDSLSHEQIMLICHSITDTFGKNELMYCIFQQELTISQVHDFFHNSLAILKNSIFLSSQIIDFSLFLTRKESPRPIQYPNMNSFLVMLLKGDFVSMQLLINEWEYSNAQNGSLSKQVLSTFRLLYEEMVFKLASEYSIDIDEITIQHSFESIQDPLTDIYTFHNYLHLMAICVYKKIQGQISGRPLILEIKKYIHEHYMEEITMNDISRHVNMNKDYLTKLYKKYENGSSPIAYLMDYRLQQAKKMLPSSEFSISEIASMTGFNSQSYFCKVFKQQIGVSPKDFRKKPRS